MTPHSNLATELAQRIAPFGLLFALLCWFRRKEEIGGWLMFFYYQIYAGMFLSVLIVAKQIGVYMPRPWKNETNHIFFIIAAIPRLVGFLMILIIATILLKKRELSWLSKLRLVMGIELTLMACSLLIDVYRFPSAFTFNLTQAILLSLWLTYFYQSQRVHQVFVTHDWGAQLRAADRPLDSR
jgi:hypothetical protein